jgi:hypothetical protein
MNLYNSQELVNKSTFVEPPLLATVHAWLVISDAHHGRVIACEE